MFLKRCAGHSYFLLVQYIPEPHQRFHHLVSDQLRRHLWFHHSMTGDGPVRLGDFVLYCAKPLDKPWNVTP